MARHTRQRWQRVWQVFRRLLGLVPPARRQAFGLWGQRRAEQFLKQQGYRILARNWRGRRGELDLVALDRHQTIVFVEVKTRRTETFTPVVAVVNRRKQRHMALAAKQFLRRFKLADKPCRFDVVTVLAPNGSKPQIQHYPSAFVP